MAVGIRVSGVVGALPSILAGAVLGLAGCQVPLKLPGTLLAEPGAGAKSAATAPATGNTTKYFVELRRVGHQPELIQLPLNGVVYMQQAMEQSGAAKQMGRFKIELYRQLPGGGTHRLNIAWDRAKRSIPSGSDYAVHPNDRIVVTEDDSTFLDDMFQALTQPFQRSG